MINEPQEIPTMQRQRGRPYDSLINQSGLTKDKGKSKVINEMEEKSRPFKKRKNSSDSSTMNCATNEKLMHTSVANTESGGIVTHDDFGTHESRASVDTQTGLGLGADEHRNISMLLPPIANSIHQ
ncbi:hypothetical protein FRX31_028313, partial [Thalictrum thalictroides]